MDFVSYKFEIVAASLAVLFVAERLQPMVPQLDTLTRLSRNFGLGFVNYFAGPLIVLPLTIFASAHGLGLRPAWWNIAPDLLVLDLWIYGWHRLNHVMPILWRFHVVHHLDEMLDSTSALRFHFGEVVLSALLRCLVIWLLAMPVASVIVFEALVVVTTLFHHSNIRLPNQLEVVLSRLVVTPRLHWVHHHAEAGDTNSNYATVLAFWDLFFASRSPTQRTPQMKIGVSGQHDASLWQLFIRPFGKN